MNLDAMNNKGGKKPHDDRVWEGMSTTTFANVAEGSMIWLTSVVAMRRYFDAET